MNCGLSSKALGKSHMSRYPQERTAVIVHFHQRGDRVVLFRGGWEDLWWLAGLKMDRGLSSKASGKSHTSRYSARFHRRGDRVVIFPSIKRYRISWLYGCGGGFDNNISINHLSLIDISYLLRIHNVHIFPSLLLPSLLLFLSLMDDGICLLVGFSNNISIN